MHAIIGSGDNSCCRRRKICVRILAIITSNSYYAICTLREKKGRKDREKGITYKFNGARVEEFRLLAELSEKKFSCERDFGPPG